MNVLTRHMERLARAKLKVDRKKNASQVKGQLSIEKAMDYEWNKRIARGEIGYLRPREIEEEILSVGDVPDVRADCQVSFVLQKKCLACKTVNKYISTECRKCAGHFCYDKT